MILNLNDPSKIEDTWIKPMKYVGIWWKCMLESTWDCRFTKQNSLTQELLPSGKHGATTENTKDTLILLKNGFDGVQG
jgi:hypothetical protein